MESINSERHVGKANSDKHEVKKENVKFEEVPPHFDDDSLKEWTETSDIKKLTVFSMDHDDLKEEEEEYEEYSDEEIRDESSTGNKDTEVLPSVMELPHKKQQGKQAFKRRKLYGSVTWKIEISNKAQSLIEKICVGAPVSPTVASSCQFHCKVCKELFNGWTPLYKHFKKLHPNVKISIAEVDKCISKTVSYICKICSVFTLCDNTFIRKHMKNHHDLLISQYIKKFHTDKLKLLPQEVTYSNDTIGNLCQFQCLDCGAKFTNRGTSRKHQINIHGNNVERGEKMIKRVLHKCKLCGKMVQCEIQYLLCHLKSVHGLTTKEYCKQTGCKYAQNIYRTFLKSKSMLQCLPLLTIIGNKCKFECRQCLKTFNTKNNFYNHIKKHNIKKINIFSCLIRGFSYQCQFCPKVLLCDKRTVIDHLKYAHGHEYLKLKKLHYLRLKENYMEMCEQFIKGVPVSTMIGNQPRTKVNDIPIHEITSKIENLCKFSCPKCNSTFSNWFSLQWHSKKIHKSGVKFNPSIVSEVRYHSCLLCPTAVLSDRYFLARHLESKHKSVLMSKYVKTFAKNGGETLPPLNEYINKSEIL